MSPAVVDDAPTTPDEVLRAAHRNIAAILPSKWHSLLTIATDAPGTPDARISLIASSQVQAEFHVHVKVSISRRDAILYAAERPNSTGPALIVARYFSPELRADLRQRGLSYADAAGNVHLRSVDPLVLVIDDSVSSDPWRKRGRPRGSLAGAPASRVIRALIDFAPPYSVQRLSELARTSLPTTYRIVDALEAEALLDREDDGKGRVMSCSWRDLLLRWSAEYGFSQSNPVSRYLAPRGIGAVVSRLRTAHPAQLYAEARLAMIYADDADEFARALDLRPVETGANVLIAEPKADFVYERSEVIDGVPLVARSQAVVDLLSGPGRNPDEGMELLRWMEVNEGDWRR
jgi:hypothetical protein